MAGERLKGESQVAYEYFKLYLKQEEPRSIGDLSAIEVLGKKRTASAIYNFSTNNNWHDRAETWDAKKSAIAIAEVFREKRDEISGYLDRQLDLGIKFQRIIGEALDLIIEGMESDPPIMPEPKQVRQWAMTYDTAGKWVGNLVGAFDKALQDNDRT